jgi:hypothetical protein
MSEAEDDPMSEEKELSEEEEDVELTSKKQKSDIYTNAYYDHSRVVVKPTPEGLHEACRRQLGIWGSVQLTTRNPELLDKHFDAFVVQQPSVYIPEKRDLPELAVAYHTEFQHYVLYTTGTVKTGTLVTAYGGNVDSALKLTGEALKMPTDIEPFAQGNIVMQGQKYDVPVTITGYGKLSALLKKGILGQLMCCTAKPQDKNCKLVMYLFTEDGRVTIAKQETMLQQYCKDEKYLIQAAGSERLARGYLGAFAGFYATRDIPAGMPLVSTHKFVEKTPLSYTADLSHVIWFAKTKPFCRCQKVIPLQSDYPKVTDDNGKIIPTPVSTQIYPHVKGLSVTGPQCKYLGGPSREKWVEETLCEIEEKKPRVEKPDVTTAPRVVVKLPDQLYQFVKIPAGTQLFGKKKVVELEDLCELAEAMKMPARLDVETDDEKPEAISEEEDYYVDKETGDHIYHKCEDPPGDGEKEIPDEKDDEYSEDDESPERSPKRQRKQANPKRHNQ